MQTDKTIFAGCINILRKKLESHFQIGKVWINTFYKGDLRMAECFRESTYNHRSCDSIQLYKLILLGFMAC